jgi:N-acetylmuramoyl-L-alanine amidase
MMVVRKTKQGWEAAPSLRRSLCSHNIPSFVVCYLLTAIMLVFLFSLPASASQGSSDSKIFHSSRNELQRLLGSSSPNQEAIRKLALRFVDLQKTEKGPTRSSCQFFAGKAFLSLYKVSKNRENLDHCIIHLNQYKKSRHNSEHYKEALFELKEAYLIKRRDKSSKVPKVSLTRSTLKTDLDNQKKSGPPNSSGSLIGPKGDGNPGPEVLPVAPQTADSENLCDRPPLNQAGNPFFRPDPNIALPQPGAINLKSASIAPPSISDAEPAKALSEPVHQRKGPVVVIDPGHGGKDPGAVSADKKVSEKDVTLEISKLLKKRVEKAYPHISVHLTRDEDTFLSLKERAKIANSLDAEVFISVHCNGSEYKSASGPEIFYLSKSSSRGAMRAAARENGVSLSKMSDLEATLIDLLTNSKKTESTRLAQVVHDSLVVSDATQGARTKDRGVKQAPFYVLIGATMPAILVECGFVNNLAQKDSAARQTFSNSISSKLAKGVIEYLKNLPANAP